MTTGIITTCPICKRKWTITVPIEGLQSWIDGALIQNALPSLSSIQREQLMTGYCQNCWDEMWREE